MQQSHGLLAIVKLLVYVRRTQVMHVMLVCSTGMYIFCVFLQSVNSAHNMDLSLLRSSDYGIFLYRLMSKFCSSELK